MFPRFLFHRRGCISKSSVTGILLVRYEMSESEDGVSQNWVTDFCHHIFVDNDYSPAKPDLLYV